MSSVDLHRLIERLASLFRESLRRTATDHGLKLVQLEALVYLASANRYSDTASGLTEYLGVTKGTISKTIEALVSHGLVDKVTDRVDGRRVHCRPTKHGLALSQQAQPTRLLHPLSGPETAAATTALTTLLRRIQASRGFRTFGECRTCRHFEAVSTRGRCGLTGERLSRLDTTRICREHDAA